jgi:hypothetical protein
MHADQIETDVALVRRLLAGVMHDTTVSPDAFHDLG